MSIQVSTSALGFKDTTEALKNMKDERGVKWKRKAFIKSGYDSFQHAVKRARTNAPVGKTGLAKRSIVSTRGRYNGKVPVSRSGKVTRGGKHEYTIGTTLSQAFDASAPKDRKGRAVRYPFMLEVGVPSQTYSRISKKGVLHSVHRTAKRRAFLFQHKALGSASSKVISTWKRSMAFYVDLYARYTHKSLTGAHKAFIRTGGKGNKWL